MKLHFVCLAFIITSLIDLSECRCEGLKFYDKTQCHLSAAGEKVADVAVAAYDGLADGYDTLKSKITGKPKQTESFDVRITSVDYPNDESAIVFPTSSETISVDDRSLFVVPKMNKCPAGTYSDSRGRCRVYS